MRETIEVGYQTFVSDGGEEFGAIREISPDGLVVYVENAGEFPCPTGCCRGGTFPEGHLRLQQAGPPPSASDWPRTRRRGAQAVARPAPYGSRCAVGNAK